jgi:crotonobetainyl-CoA:carnitine CoA-transferase CaiB-like acyl-CoA transferase
MERAAVLSLVMLAGRRARIEGRGCAAAWASHLLASLGAEVVRAPGPDDLPDAVAWARSGAMALTGPVDGPPRGAPGPLASAARGALDALRALAPDAEALCLDGAALLGERAACFGYTRQGRIAPSGSCRLLRSADGWIALNLARDEDRASLPAWLERDGDARADAWDFAAQGVALRSADDLVLRAGWLGLAVAHAAPAPATPPAWLRWSAHGERASTTRPPLVLDLSALWAGPLATELLAAAGARVVKVESVRRPDGARRGPSDFFDLHNARKASVALDLGSPRGCAQLEALARRADVVVESARPRALAQLGLVAEAWLAGAPGRTWLSLTGYGRGDPSPGRVAFGDDAGVAAGLAVATGDADGPLFCGDAIADPLAGLHAALAVQASRCAGGGHLLDVALRDVCAHAAAFRTPEDVAAPAVEAASPPRARRPPRAARPLGADTAAVCAELGVPC